MKVRKSDLHCYEHIRVNVRRASHRYQLKYVYSALGLLAVHSIYIYISTLGFLLAMPVQKGFKVWLMYGVCVAYAIPCIKLTSGSNVSSYPL